MGMDLSIHVVYGWRVKRTKIRGTRPSCEHPERLGHQFCPTCGFKVVEIPTEKSEVPADGRWGGIEIYNPGAVLGGQSSEIVMGIHVPPRVDPQVGQILELPVVTPGLGIQLQEAVRYLPPEVVKHIPKADPALYLVTIWS